MLGERGATRVRLLIRVRETLVDLGFIEEGIKWISTRQNKLKLSCS